MNNFKLNPNNYDIELYDQLLQKKKNLKTTKRNSYILPEFTGKVIYVYNGLIYKKIKITENMVGTKFGQYVLTRKICKHKIKKDTDINGFAYVKLSNKRIKKISLKCKATIGRLSNPYHDLYNYKKAGLIRNLNKRPIVRGVAMNPIDHPHGGGEGKASGGRVSVTPWGFITKGRKTVKNKNHYE